MSDGEKTPWNPSRRAIARVLDPLPLPTHCRLCGAECKVVNNSAIYGKPYGDWPWAVLCTGCGAYVGLHPFTNIPLGTVALRPLRDARKAAKREFNPLWRDGAMTRTEAYTWLAGELGIPVAQCHIGWFEQDQCNAAIAAIHRRNRK